tara:strand:- start:3336 stop:3563 length:228 start_codon:yes stop_codon:yes gene_type:complete
MKIKIGKKYLHNTFAGVKVVSKIIEEEQPGIFMGQLVRKKDIASLKKAGVAYTGKEKLSSCVGVVYPFQVIREWK